MVYALWDIESNNLVAEFDHLEDALALVRRALARNGPDDAESLALDVEDEHGEVRVIAHGQRLAELAAGMAPAF